MSLGEKKECRVGGAPSCVTKPAKQGDTQGTGRERRGDAGMTEREGREKGMGRKK